MISNLQGDFQTLFILTDDYSTYSGERHNFELWADLTEGLATESDAAKNVGSRIYFEMLDETDAQIIEGFELGHCVISDNLITEHIAEICKDM